MTSTSSSSTTTAQNIKADFKLVEGGTFQMGSTDERHDENPVHTVRVSSFYMCDHEVTQKEYRDVMGTNPSKFSGDNLPVERVSWYNAVEYCNKLSIKEGLTPCYTINGSSTTCNFNANGYRLPTESEWEYAARGGKKSNGYTYAGSNSVGNVAWYDDNSGSQTHNVKTKAPNELGLYDMSGNVWEWCWDWYGNYSSGSQTNPSGSSSGSYRVERGGSWYSYPSNGRVAFRYYDSPSRKYNNLGFRVVRSASK
ncbi:MAG: formylglycine-generating enzyme family protein [Treponema sp.]|nr:formylglycine-generating enzyme family protein [Treponema sp.]MBR6297227.1 formylglycine-generating enzyme family protein [Treponema sp.]